MTNLFTNQSPLIDAISSAMAYAFNKDNNMLLDQYGNAITEAQKIKILLLDNKNKQEEIASLRSQLEASNKDRDHWKKGCEEASVIMKDLRKTEGFSDGRLSRNDVRQLESLKAQLIFDHHNPIIDDIDPFRAAVRHLEAAAPLFDAADKPHCAELCRDVAVLGEEALRKAKETGKPLAHLRETKEPDGSAFVPFAMAIGTVIGAFLTAKGSQNTSTGVRVAEDASETILDAAIDQLTTQETRQ